jgi:hypothetical protein
MLNKSLMILVFGSMLSVASALTVANPPKDHPVGPIGISVQGGQGEQG